MPKATSAVFFCLLAASLSVAQHWEFEQVDTGGMGARLHMQRDSSGKLCLAYYHEVTGQVRLARRDSVWRFEDPGIPPSCRLGFSFDIGPHGEEAVLYDTAGWAALFAERRSSGWDIEVFPESAEAYCLVFDTSGAPNVVYDRNISIVLTHLSRAERTDSGWRTSTVDTGKVNYSNYFGCFFLVVDGADRLHAFCRNCWQFPPAPVGRPIFGQDISLYRQLGSVWQCSLVATVSARGFRSLSMALDSLGNEAVCYSGGYSPGYFYFNGSRIDSGSSSARVAIDSLDRPHIAFVFRSLIYRYLDSRGWHIDTRSPDTNIVVGDVLFDSAGQPIVAYHVPGNGVWLARGVDIVGVERTPNAEVRTLNAGPSIVRGVLLLPVSHFSIRSSLFDQSGRKVMELAPGPNDVSGLAPGVYFVREQSAFSSQHSGPSAVRKAVVTR